MATLRARIAGALRPTVGEFGFQYEPRTLRVPAWYLRSSLPDPPPTITIVTPSLNQGRFIARTVESVLAQDYPRLEYVVKDGGSTDDTLERLERYRDRIDRIDSGPDGGQAAAINAGFAATEGEIMMWLNSDDVLLPGSLAYVARWFARHPEVDVLYGNRVLIDEWDRDHGISALPSHHPDVVRWSCFVPQESSFWRRRAWDRHGPLDEGLRFVMDWDLYRRFEAGGAGFAHTRRRLGAYRRHTTQKTDFEAHDPIPAGFRAEQELIHRRYNGFCITPEETHMRTHRYRVRALPARWRERALDRVPLPRVPVYFAQ